MLFYKLVVGLVALGLTFAFVVPNLNFLFSSEELKEIFRLIEEFATSLFSGNNEYLASFREVFDEAVGALGLLVTANLSNLVWTIIGVFLSYILFRFLDTLGNFVFASMLNEKMNSYAESAFFDCFIRNIGKGSLYAIFYTLLSVAYHLFLALFVYFFFFWILSSVPLLITLMMASAVVAVMEALKLTLTSNWIPAIIEGKMKTWQAFSYGFQVKVKYRAAMFSAYLITLYIVIAVNAVMAIFTLMSSLLLSVPASFLFLLCLQFVNYYTIEGKKYFVNYYKIADNKDRGQKSRFLAEDTIKEEPY